MKKFTAPEMEVVNLEVADVITASIDYGDNETEGSPL